MPAHFQNGEKCDGSKVCASVHTMPEQFENGRKFDCRNSLQDFDAKEAYFTLRIDKSLSESVERCSVFIIFVCSNSAVSKMCRLDKSRSNRFHVRVPFSKSTVFKICRQKICRFHVNGRPIRHIFHRFQNVPASCECSLR